jgi:hypothetical protein
MDFALGRYLATAVAIYLVLWFSCCGLAAAGATIALILDAAVLTTVDSPNLSDAANPTDWV